MNISTNISNDERDLVISVNGNFNIDLLSEFRVAYLDMDKKGIVNFLVDLRNTEMMDSSALGMLLNMKRTLNQPDLGIKIVNCAPSIKKILLIARFDKIFLID